MALAFHTSPLLQEYSTDTSLSHYFHGFRQCSITLPQVYIVYSAYLVAHALHFTRIYSSHCTTRRARDTVSWPSRNCFAEQHFRSIFRSKFREAAYEYYRTNFVMQNLLNPYLPVHTNIGVYSSMILDARHTAKNCSISAIDGLKCKRKIMAFQWYSRRQNWT